MRIREIGEKWYVCEGRARGAFSGKSSVEAFSNHKKGYLVLTCFHGASGSFRPRDLVKYDKEHEGTRYHRQAARNGLETCLVVKSMLILQRTHVQFPAPTSLSQGFHSCDETPWPTRRQVVEERFIWPTLPY